MGLSGSAALPPQRAASKTPNGHETKARVHPASPIVNRGRPTVEPLRLNTANGR